MTGRQDDRQRTLDKYMILYMIDCTLIERDEMLILKNYIKGKMTTIMKSSTRRVGESLSEYFSKNSPTLALTPVGQSQPPKLTL